MIALYPPPALAKQLVLPGGEAAAELHITIAYLGRRSGLPVEPAQLVAQLREAAAKAAALRGQLGGIIRFPASESSEGRDPFCAGVDLPGLVELRELLRQVLEAQGVKLSADHGFTPHVTLAYLAPDAPAPVAQIPPRPVMFTEALLVVGEERWPLQLGPAPAALQRYFRGAHVRFEHEAEPRVGVWDQVCNYGTHTKPSIAGKPLVTSFNAATCRQMLEDFAARKNDLFLDKQHEVTEEGLTGDDDLQAWGDQHAMAWYNAMAHVSEGKVVGYAAHAGAPPAAPSLEDMRRPDGALPASGLYALRSAVTPRGADPKEGIPAFRYVSPYFYQRDEGHYRLLNITATNDPFLDGVALAMSASKYAGADTPKEKKPMEELYTRAGCMEGDTPDQKLEKMARYAQQLEEKEKAAEMARAKMEADKAFAGKETPEEEKKEAAAMARRLKALEEKNAMLETTVKEQGSTLAAEREARAKQEKAERDSKAAAFARDAIAMGRVKADHKGDPGKTQEWLAAKFVKDPAEAEDVLSPEGTFAISEPAVLQRMTRGGAGIGAPDPRGTQGTDAVDNWGRLITAEQNKARAAGKELRFADAEKLVKAANPAAYQAYTRQKVGG